MAENRNYIDPWTTPSSEWEYIAIPAKDAIGYVHPDVSINKHKFEAGQRHLVPAAIAREIERILEGHATQTRRLLQPDVDVKALNDVAKMGRSA